MFQNSDDVVNTAQLVHGLTKHSGRNLIYQCGHSLKMELLSYLEQGGRPMSRRAPPSPLAAVHEGCNFRGPKEHRGSGKGRRRVQAFTCLRVSTISTVSSLSGRIGLRSGIKTLRPRPTLFSVIFGAGFTTLFFPPHVGDATFDNQLDKFGTQIKYVSPSKCQSYLCPRGEQRCHAVFHSSGTG